MIVKANNLNYSNYDLDIKNNPYFNMYIYVINNIQVGFIKYSYIYDRIEILDLYVEEDYRYKKIGTKLINELFKYNVPITLEVNENNYAAINLYKKYGFKSVAIRKSYYNNNDNAILMERI